MVSYELLAFVFKTLLSYFLWQNDFPVTLSNSIPPPPLQRKLTSVGHGKSLCYKVKTLRNRSTVQISNTEDVLGLIPQLNPHLWSLLKICKTRLFLKLVQRTDTAHNPAKVIGILFSKSNLKEKETKKSKVKCFVFDIYLSSMLSPQF